MGNALTSPYRERLERALEAPITQPIHHIASIIAEASGWTHRPQMFHRQVQAVLWAALEAGVIQTGRENGRDTVNPRGTSGAKR